MSLSGSSRWQSREHLGTPEEMTGMLLVASPSLADPNFSRTVVLVLDHSPSGTIGLVLNRPTGVPVEEILRQWHDQAALASPAVIFSGGPVSPGAVIGLVRGTIMGEPAGWRSVIGEVGTVDLSVPPDDQPALEGARLFSGYSGWASDQLDDEIDEGAWFVLGAAEEDLLSSEPEQLWHDVLRRQGGELGMLASFPPHPSVN
jgi:putative transcriptional regulator